MKEEVATILIAGIGISLLGQAGFRALSLLLIALILL